MERKRGWRRCPRSSAAVVAPDCDQPKPRFPSVGRIPSNRCPKTIVWAFWRPWGNRRGSVMPGACQSRVGGSGSIAAGNANGAPAAVPGGTTAQQSRAPRKTCRSRRSYHAERGARGQVTVARRTVSIQCYVTNKQAIRLQEAGEPHGRCI
jgi:hypothetical protein